MFGVQSVPAIPQPLHHAGAVVFQHHIGALQEGFEDCAVLGGLQVQRDRGFVRVQRGEIGAFTGHEGREGAGVIAGSGAFKLDHFGPKIGKGVAGERTGQHIGKVQNGDAGKRGCHGVLTVMAWQTAYSNCLV